MTRTDPTFTTDYDPLERAYPHPPCWWVYPQQVCWTGFVLERYWSGECGFYSSHT
jgi:hypothetical protein